MAGSDAGGAGQGIGRTIAVSHAREGAQVVGADFNEHGDRETVVLIAAAKGGVTILTRGAAAEYGARGIRINAVSPGVIRPSPDAICKERFSGCNRPGNE